MISSVIFPYEITSSCVRLKINQKILRLLSHFAKQKSIKTELIFAAGEMLRQQGVNFRNRCYKEYFQNMKR